MSDHRNTQLPTPSATTDSRAATMGSDRRRLQNTSEDSSGSIYSDVTAYRYRAGAPALHILPLHNTALNEESPSGGPLLIELENRRGWIEERLEGSSITFHSVEFVHRAIRGDAPSKNNIFVFIRAEWNENAETDWLRMAVYLRDELKRSLGFSTLGVEILAPQLYLEKFMTIVESDHPFVEIWTNGLQDRVLGELLRNQALCRKLCAVNAIRLGYNRKVDENPVTILITIDWSVNPTAWAGELRNLENILTEYDQSLRPVILIENGENTRFLGPGQGSTTPFTSHKNIQPGVSIGGKLMLSDEAGEPSCGKVGTVGPILSIKKNDECAIVALTNYHVIRSWIPGFIIPAKIIPGGPNQTVAIRDPKRIGLAVEGSKLDQMDRHPLGFGPLDTSFLTPDEKAFRSPALFVEQDELERAKGVLAFLQQRLATAQANGRFGAVGGEIQQKIDATRAEIVELESFHTDVEKTVLGELFLGSSPKYRTIDGSRVDTALIRLNQHSLSARNINNNLPDVSTFPAHVQEVMYSSVTRLTGIAPLRRQTDQMLFKVGVATKSTCGKFSKMSGKVFLGHDGDHEVAGEARGTTEFCVVGWIGASEPKMDLGGAIQFANQGDSGAAVWNEYGEWVGVVFGGTSVAQTKPNGRGDYVTYLTPAEEVCKHIKTILPGCEIELY